MNTNRFLHLYVLVRDWDRFIRFCKLNRYFDEFGVSPTKVRKVPQDSCQLPGRKGFSAIPELPRRDLV